MVGIPFYVNNCFIASTAHNFLIVKLLHEATITFNKVKNHPTKSIKILETTGPTMMSLAIKKYQNDFKINIIPDYLIELYPFEIKKYESKAYIAHYSECSWSVEEKGKNFFLNIFKAAGFYYFLNFKNNLFRKSSIGNWNYDTNYCFIYYSSYCDNSN